MIQLLVKGEFTTLYVFSIYPVSKCMPIYFYCIDLLTVNETSTEPPADEEKSINSPNNLALEATYINHNLSQQVLRMVRNYFFNQTDKHIFELYQRLTFDWFSLIFLMGWFLNFFSEGLDHFKTKEYSPKNKIISIEI